MGDLLSEVDIDSIKTKIDNSIKDAANKDLTCLNVYIWEGKYKVKHNIPTCVIELPKYSIHTKQLIKELILYYTKRGFTVRRLNISQIRIYWGDILYKILDGQFKI